MRFDPSHIKTQIHALLALYPELAEDEVLRGDTLEGSTDLHECLRIIERQRQEAKALAASIDTVIEQLTQRANRFARRDEALRKLMFDLLQAASLKRIELPEATLSVRNGTPFVIITDEAALPKEYIRVRTEPNKQLIKDAIKNGDHVEGAMLSNAEPTLAVRIK